MHGDALFGLLTPFCGSDRMWSALIAWYNFRLWCERFFRPIFCSFCRIRLCDSLKKEFKTHFNGRLLKTFEVFGVFSFSLLLPIPKRKFKYSSFLKICKKFKSIQRILNELIKGLITTQLQFHYKSVKFSNWFLPQYTPQYLINKSDLKKE